MPENIFDFKIHTEYVFVHCAVQKRNVKLINVA